MDVFCTGPRSSKWASLGCYTWSGRDTGVPMSADCVLLLALHKVLKERGGGVQNEAFIDDVNGGGALLGECSGGE